MVEYRIGFVLQRNQHLYPPECNDTGAYLLKSLGFEKAKRRLPAKGVIPVSCRSPEANKCLYNLWLHIFTNI